MRRNSDYSRCVAARVFDAADHQGFTMAAFARATGISRLRLHALRMGLTPMLVVEMGDACDALGISLVVLAERAEASW